jgi:uncharacterized protein YmfQ (DUF2313 family)
MSRDYKTYRKLIQSLLPKGAFWTRAETSILTQLLDGLAEVFSRIEQRSEDLIPEAFSDTVTELLEEWEEDFSIPDPGFELASSTTGRRQVIAVKKLAVGAQNKDYFIEIASTLGWTVTITQFAKSLTGLFTVGDSIITDDRAPFYWMVNIHVDDPNNARIYQLLFDITTRAPGHTSVLYRFYNVAFSNSFDNSFNAAPWWDGSWWPLDFSSDFSIAFGNATDYDGKRLIGPFAQEFSESFDVRLGGMFGYNEFDFAFRKPAYDAYVKGGSFNYEFDAGFDRPSLN